MWSGEEAGRAPVPGSACPEGVEALFAEAGAGCVERSASPELQRLRGRLRGVLQPHERALLGLQRLLVWDRPVHSAAAALALNTAFWLLSSTSLRPLFLISVALLAIVLLDRWKDKLTALYPDETEAERESISGQPRLLTVAELSHHLAESYLTCTMYIQEMLQYKRQNHGKFCVMTCSGCLLLTVVSHYIPGIMISYIILLSVLLWPLVVYHELIQKMYTGLEPILMKLDYSMKGDTQHRKHEKRKVKKEEGDEPRAETESESEEELSCFAPTVDVKTTALAMAITDSELSDEEASILESGGFSVSRATTPQLTDVSEDLDQQSVHSEPEETFSKDLPEFPSVEEFPSIEPGLFSFGVGAQEEAQSPASLLIQHLASPLHFVNTHFNGHGRAARSGSESETATRSLEALSEEIVSSAISAVVQNTLSALLGSPEAAEAAGVAEFLPSETPPCPTESPPEEGERTAEDVTLVPPDDEDFELLDQSELEHADEGLGMEDNGQEVGGMMPTDTPTCDQRQES